MWKSVFFLNYCKNETLNKEEIAFCVDVGELLAKRSLRYFETTYRLDPHPQFDLNFTMDMRGQKGDMTKMGKENYVQMAQWLWYQCKITEDSVGDCHQAGSMICMIMGKEVENIYFKHFPK